MLGDEIDLSAHEDEFRAAALELERVGLRMLDLSPWGPDQRCLDCEGLFHAKTCHRPKLVKALARFRRAAGVTPRNGEGGEG